MLRKSFPGVPNRQMAIVLTLLAGNLLLVGCCWSSRGRSSGVHSGDLAAIYFSQGQYVLLAAWCAWGTGRAVMRWLITLGSLAAVTLTINLCAARSLGRYSDTLVDVSACGAILLAGWYALFLPWRWLLGWRLTLDTAAQQRPRGQFRLKHWLTWTAAFGLPLALARLLYPGPRVIECLFACVLLGLFALPFVVIFFRTAFSRRPWLWTAVALALAVLAGVADESLVVYGLMDDGATLSWQFRWMHIQQFCGMNLGLAAGLLGNLLMLRLMGMRFASGRKVPSADACSAVGDAGWGKLAVASAGPRE